MKKTIKIVILFFTLVTGFISCNAPENKPHVRPNRIVISGSSTMASLVGKLAQEFNKGDSALEILITEIGSGKGIDQLKSEKSNIAMLSKFINHSEIDTAKFKVLQIALDGVIPVVSAKVYEKVKALSLKEIKLIYAGTITNWKEFNGYDEPIFVIDKIATSGTRKVYMKQLFNDENAEALGASFVANTTEEEVELIEESNTAIGMLSNAWIDDDIKGLSIITDNGLITPIKENIDNGTYPIIRPLYLVYSVNADANTLAFIEFVKSEKGKTIIQKEGYSSASNVY